MRILALRFVIGLLCAFACSGNAVACKLTSDSSFYWPDEELVKATKTILLVKVAKVELPTSSALDSKGRADYQLEVINVIKGSHPEKTLKLSDLSPPPKEYRDGTKKHAAKNFTGRAAYGPDCKIDTYAYPGKTYLLFVDGFHPKFFEQVSGESDAWLKQVKKLTGSTQGK